MTEIKIEKKKLLWPWILVIVILGLIIYLMLLMGHKETEKEDPDTKVLSSVNEHII